MRYFIAFILIFTLSFSAYSQGNYYPLKKGKTWIYKFGPDFSKDPDQRAKIEIGKKMVTINGKEYFSMNSYTGKGETFTRFQTTYLRVAEDGTVYGSSGQEGSEEEILIPGGELKAGDSWTSGMGGTPVTSTVLEVSGSILTPGQIFDDCLVTELIVDGTRMRSYYQKSVGLVAVSVFVVGAEKVMQYLDVD